MLKRPYNAMNGERFVSQGARGAARCTCGGSSRIPVAARRSVFIICVFQEQTNPCFVLLVCGRRQTVPADTRRTPPQPADTRTPRIQ